MGCATSKKEDEDNVVSLCKERKRLMKLAVERRYALADTQCKYNQSLYAVAAAIRLFVARHSSPSSPFLITFPASSTNDAAEAPITNPMFLKQRPTEPTSETVPSQSSHSTVFLKRGNDDQGQEDVLRTQENKEHCLESSEEEQESEEEEDEVVCEHFYGEEAPPAMPSQEKELAWDFFNPFDELRTEVVSNSSDSSDEELRVVREKEGIPDLEEDVERVLSERKVDNVKIAGDGDGESKNTGVRNGDDYDANVSQGERNSFRMINTHTNERELLEALKDVEDHFLRAYDSGLDVCRMLEANRVQLQSGLEEFKGL